MRKFELDVYDAGARSSRSFTSAYSQVTLPTLRACLSVLRDWSMRTQGITHSS